MKTTHRFAIGSALVAGLTIAMVIVNASENAVVPSDRPVLAKTETPRESAVADSQLPAQLPAQLPIVEPLTSVASSPPVVSAPPAATAAANMSPTLPESVQSFLAGRTPSEVLEDGTQVFTDIPFSVRQPDGSMREQLSTIKIKPVPALPALDAAQGGDVRGR